MLAHGSVSHTTAVAPPTSAAQYNAPAHFARGSLRSRHAAAQPNPRIGCGSHRGSPSSKSKATPATSSAGLTLTVSFRIDTTRAIASPLTLARPHRLKACATELCACGEVVLWHRP